MLPTDIYSIIENYNEIGIFLKDDVNTYWFNGKRWELWKPVKKFKFYSYAAIKFEDVIYNFLDYRCYNPKTNALYTFAHPIEIESWEFVVLVNDLFYLKVNQHLWIFNPNIGWKLEAFFEFPGFIGRPYEITLPSR